MTNPVPLASAEWLAENIGRDNVRTVDASWYMPGSRRDGAAEFKQGHIPGAVFFSINDIAAPDTDLPHMVPGADAFGHAVGRLGISNDDHVVVYATTGIATAPRVWWMFRLFGHDRVSVLDGGMRAWIAAGGNVETGSVAPTSRTFHAQLRPEFIRDFEAVRKNVHSESGHIPDDRSKSTFEEPPKVLERPCKLLDARSQGRFKGTDPEPRADLQSGHIPESLNLPYERLLDSGSMRSPEELTRIFHEVGVGNDESPLILSCGSGVSACVLGLGLSMIGHNGWSVYDGSWTEWGGRADAPVKTG